MRWILLEHLELFSFLAVVLIISFLSIWFGTSKQQKERTSKNDMGVEPPYFLFLIFVPLHGFFILSAVSFVTEHITSLASKFHQTEKIESSFFSL